jgi:ribosomal-protein-alanine N-acetyltransferase
MTESDIDPVLDIEREAYNRPWTREHFEKELDNHIAYMYSLTGKHKGREVFAGYVVFWVVYGEAHILNLTIAEAFRRQGLGVYVMRQVLEMMKASMVDDVFLEVRKSNVAAKELYRKLNFKESYERKKYYGDEDAVIMRLIFNEYI